AQPQRQLGITRGTGCRPAARTHLRAKPAELRLRPGSTDPPLGGAPSAVQHRDGRLRDGPAVSVLDLRPGRPPDPPHASPDPEGPPRSPRASAGSPFFRGSRLQSQPLSSAPAGGRLAGRRLGPPPPPPASSGGRIRAASPRRLKKMQKAKKGGGDLTRSFHKKKRGCKTEWVSGHLRDGDSNRDVFAKLPDRVKSDICKSVVSISLCNGDVPLFSCSGIAIARKGYRLTKCLTSASLVRAFDGKTNEDYYELKIEVRCEGNEVYMGFLDEYDLDHNFAVVNIDAFLDVHVGSSQSMLKSVLPGEAYVVGRGVSGDLISRSVELVCDPRVSKHDQDLESETSKAWEGGIIFSLNGESVGMSLFLVKGKTSFLPWGTIFEHLRHFWTSWQRSGAPVVGKSNSRPEAPRYLLNQEQLDLDSMGYPKLPSTKDCAGMVLVNTFEETFGDIHGKGVWRKLGEQAFSTINCNVVALASYNGERRFFACTGFFIRWNESTIILTSASLIRSSGDGSNIVENLRIAVSPCDGKIREGTLEHYNLHYNVALVSVKDFYVSSPANTVSNRYTPQVAAVGRCFESGALMATSGELVSWTGTLDCNYLVRSSCKITKAGIGGPLVTLDGNVLGMNFYDKKIGTPFMSLLDIFLILKSSKSHPSGAAFWKMDGDDAARLNRWPVPMPCWRPLNYVDDESDESDDEDDDGSLEYGYRRGEKVILI
ncbi:hypothetical protein U9M48_043955, partial [Paspalum notatum var. saurae]